MSNIKIMVDTKKRTLFFMVSVFFIFLLSFIFNSIYIFPNLKTRESLTSTTTATTNNTSKQVIITFYYKKDAKLCPECNSAKMEWEAFVKDNDGNSINDYSIVCKTMDCSNERDPDVMNALQQNKIIELPAVKMLVNGNSLPYRTQITKSNLETFINRIFNLLS